MPAPVPPTRTRTRPRLPWIACAWLLLLPVPEDLDAVIAAKVDAFLNGAPKAIAESLKAARPVTGTTAAR